MHRVIQGLTGRNLICAYSWRNFLGVPELEHLKCETSGSELTYTRVAPDEPLPGQALVDILEGDALTDTVGVQVSAQEAQHGLGAFSVVPCAATRHCVRRAGQLIVFQPIPEGGDDGGRVLVDDG